MKELGQAWMIGQATLLGIKKKSSGADASKYIPLVEGPYLSMIWLSVELSCWHKSTLFLKEKADASFWNYGLHNSKLILFLSLWNEHRIVQK